MANTYEIEKTDEEIDGVLNRAAEQEDKGVTKWRNMTYEQGVQAGIHWLIGNWEDNPMPEE